MALETRYQNKGWTSMEDCILSENWNGLFGDITADQLM